VIRERVHWLVLAMVLALSAEALNTVGWFAWKRAARTLSIRPDAGAALLISDPLLALPSAVQRTRRMNARDLGMVSREMAVSSLARIGRLQTGWLPADPVGFVNLAREALLGDQVEVASALLEKAISRDTTSPYAHRFQALVLLHLGRLEKALGHLALAEGIAPGLRSPMVELTEEDERRVRIEGLRLRRSLYPRNRVGTALALARELRSRGAEATAEAGLAELRGHPEVELELARWAVEAERYEEALKLLAGPSTRTAYPRALRARAWSMVATARDLSGDSNGALSAAQTALRLDPDSPAPYVTLAYLAQRRGDLQVALGHLRRAWGMAPADTRLLLRIATVAEQAGKSSDALLALERAVVIEPGSTELAARLVELQLRSGRYTEAAMSLSRALDRFPTDPRLLGLAERLRREVGSH